MGAVSCFQEGLGPSTRREAGPQASVLEEEESPARF